MYGLLEKQFHSYFKKAERQRGVTGTNLLILLERRLDNIIYRLGLANSRSQARLLVRHRHFTVNRRIVDIPSYLVKVGDVIEVKEEKQASPPVAEAMAAVERRGVSQWLELDKKKFKGVVKAFPMREELTMPIQEQLIVELYSK
jgi:small subunit ribosomal protein S4